MLLDSDGATIAAAFERAVARYGRHPFIVLPEDRERGYDPGGRTLSYGQAGAAVERIATALAAAGYGHGHRIAALLGNRAELLLLKLAMSRLGISWVPINPDYRPAELGYVLGDCAADLAIVAADGLALMTAAVAASGRRIAVWQWRDDLGGLPPAARVAPLPGPVHAQTEASLLYTSGTTGRPKGCILSHDYELMMGAWYASRGGLFTLREAAERVYNPLPLFHVNAGIVMVYGLMLTGNCLVVPERFSARKWWRDVRASRATGCHYLGIVIPALINAAPSTEDRGHGLRWGFGAGVEPTLHAAFEERFGFPLIEVWGMTEMCRVLCASEVPRSVGTRAMGRPQTGLEVRVVDRDDRDVATGEAGEMVVRHSAATPRKGAFSGYLNQPEATEAGWRGGWWHTGDTVRQDATGMLYFVDRKKNIIRRSGENIAAAEVEAVLQASDQVAQAAVLAVADEMRDEEVLAAVVLNDGPGTAAVARALFDDCLANLAYFKAPGWIVFVPELPVTGTQKILKHMIFGDDVDPRTLPAAHDLRAMKRRSRE